MTQIVNYRSVPTTQKEWEAARTVKHRPDLNDEAERLNQILAVDNEEYRGWLNSPTGTAAMVNFVLAAMSMKELAIKQDSPLGSREVAEIYRRLRVALRRANALPEQRRIAA